VAYKYIFAMLIVRWQPCPVSYVIKYILLFFALVDFILNTVSMSLIIFKGRTDFPVCAAATLFGDNKKFLGFGEAADTLISLTIAAVVVGFILWDHMSHFEYVLWAIAASINLFGSGVMRVWAVVTHKE